MITGNLKEAIFSNDLTLFLCLLLRKGIFVVSYFLKPEDFEGIFSSLKIETYSKSILSLFSLRLLSRINYKPYYQRNYVWDDHKATYFIESIIIGTEIPPLIFFNNGGNFEVIDGRQRFETINRFKNSEFALTNKGLSILKQLAKSSYQSLKKDNIHVIDLFLDATIRIIEFEIIDERHLDPELEDKIKKEIFSRYNSGITPLKRPEIDNAVYNKDPITQQFKIILKKDSEFKQSIHQIFLKQNQEQNGLLTEKILQFIRRQLILNKFPVKYYARGTSRTEILTKLYNHFLNRTENIEALCSSFIEKVRIIASLKEAFSTLNYNHNRLVFECLLWIFLVLENEKINLPQVVDIEFIKRIGEIISNNIEKYTEINSHFYNNIMVRYSFTSAIFEKELGLNLQIYVDKNYDLKNQLKAVGEANDTVTKLSELESLRIKKPEPSRHSIDDTVVTMERKRFLVRPSYQRAEVINLSKASAIIESILLGINLPPIFIFKRLDGVLEVIDGQQRILTILGFIGQQYLNEDNNNSRPRNWRFSLRGLRILKNLQGKKFADLDETLRDKILDFELLVVEIEERFNPEFNPVDLFIRLNDKPYPIRENSFEMWNSWVEREVIAKIKENVNKHLSWFHLKVARNRNDRDRMENEELYTSLAYLEFEKLQKKEILSYLDVYRNTDWINARIRSIKGISNLLALVSEDSKSKQQFLDSIKSVESFITKVKLVLLDKDISDKTELSNYLKTELDGLYKARKESHNFKRTKQDFYILWYALNALNLQMVKYFRLEIKQEIQDIFYNMKNVSPSAHSNDRGAETFIALINNFHQKYKVDQRKTKLSTLEKANLIKDQGNLCAVSGATIFLGDDIEVDHRTSLAIGGADSKENLQIVHKDSNRSKGVN